MDWNELPDFLAALIHQISDKSHVFSTANDALRLSVLHFAFDNKWRRSVLHFLFQPFAIFKDGRFNDTAPMLKRIFESLQVTFFNQKEFLVTMLKTKALQRRVKKKQKKKRNKTETLAVERIKRGRQLPWIFSGDIDRSCRWMKCCCQSRNDFYDQANTSELFRRDLWLDQLSLFFKNPPLVKTKIRNEFTWLHYLKWCKTSLLHSPLLRDDKQRHNWSPSKNARTPHRFLPTPISKAPHPRKPWCRVHLCRKWWSTSCLMPQQSMQCFSPEIFAPEENWPLSRANTF